VSVAIVGGTLAAKAGNGGNAWTRLSWVLGLRRLGYDTYLVEEVDAADAGARAYFTEVAAAFRLGERSSLLVGDDDQVGLSRGDVRDVASGADLLVNIDGNVVDPAIKERVARRVYVDDDPGFTQLWHAAGTRAYVLEGHDRYFTFGENIGRAFCPIPTVGIDWRPTRPPVVLDEWPPAADGRRDVLTTVGTWRPGHGRVEHAGVAYGLKAHQFRKVIELPERAPQRFELALDIHPDETGDLELLRSHGWELVDPSDVAFDPGAFRRFVEGSGGEFSAAQGLYVETESGWFSDRTVRYLASGKPVLVQDTGFSRNLPTGEGLLAYRTLEDAVAGARAISEEYDRHAAAARRVAEEHFDSDKILGRILDDLG
jgi:hypothetical protein